MGEGVGAVEGEDVVGELAPLRLADLLDEEVPRLGPELLQAAHEELRVLRLQLDGPVDSARGLLLVLQRRLEVDASEEVVGLGVLRVLLRGPLERPRRRLVPPLAERLFPLF